MRTPEFTCLALPLRWTFTSCARGVVTCKDREVILSVVVICVEFLKSDQTCLKTYVTEGGLCRRRTNAGVPDMRSRILRSATEA